MMYTHTQFPMPSSTGSSVITLKLRAKCSLQSQHVILHSTETLPLQKLYLNVSDGGVLQ
jgi:hypothetical protein